MIQGNQQDGRILYKYLFIIILHINIGSFIMLFFFFSTPQHTPNIENIYMYILVFMVIYVVMFVRMYVGTYTSEKRSVIFAYIKKKKKILKQWVFDKTNVQNYRDFVIIKIFLRIIFFFKYLLENIFLIL